jgi:alkyl hydroperoxide reductase subunit AhpC
MQVLSVESDRDAWKEAGVQVLGISCDNADSLHAWAAALGCLSFPVLADFWPHGKVCADYGVLNENGVPDRVMVLVGPDGNVAYLDNSHINEVPPIAPIREACRRFG